MLGILYLLLCFSTGFVICSCAFPGLSGLTEKDYELRRINLSPYLLLIPAWFVTGTLCMGWATYFIAYLFGDRDKPLFYADMVVMPFAFAVFLIVLIGQYRKHRVRRFELLSKNRKAVYLELAVVAAIAILGAILMWDTFFIRGDRLYIGVSVFSDFSPHIGMIRSFSYGNNFPTTYSHYAGEDIKYHFMFQFLVGNLEFLGLRLDHAFNVPSLISFITAFMTIYVLAVKITGKLAAGVLSCLFFAFRSAGTLFTYLANLPEDVGIIRSLIDNTSFISDTPHEDWGLWNLNVYCNQRHLAFGLTAFFLIVILFLPRLYEMFESLKQYKLNQSSRIKKDRKGFISKLAERVKVIFFTKEAWAVRDFRGAVAAGILLGSLTFFHGAASIGCLLVLFVMAVMSKHRLEYLITAVITLILAYLQTGIFIENSAFITKYYFGFIAEIRTLFGVASYLDRLLGLLPLVLLAAFCLEKGVGRYLMLAFTAPLIFAFTVSLTVDVTVNHKYIMMSCILLGIYAASLITKLFARKDLLISLVGIFLVICLTATGIYDFSTILRKNTPDTAVVLDLKSPLTEWVDENSNSKDIFLTANYTVNQLVLGGAMLYEGWPYYPWSAGYDTYARADSVKQMYEAASFGELDALVKENNIRFIVVDVNNRQSEDYSVNEDNIEASYECVYTEGGGDYKLSIYDTQKPLN